MRWMEGCRCQSCFVQKNSRRPSPAHVPVRVAQNASINFAAFPSPTSHIAHRIATSQRVLTRAGGICGIICRTSSTPTKHLVGRVDEWTISRSHVGSGKGHADLLPTQPTCGSSIPCARWRPVRKVSARVGREQRIVKGERTTHHLLCFALKCAKKATRSALADRR